MVDVLEELEGHVGDDLDDLDGVGDCVLCGVAGFDEGLEGDVEGY